MSGAIGVGGIGTFVIGGMQPAVPVTPPVLTPTSTTTPSENPSSRVSLTTFYLEWNGDLILTPNGSVLMAQGWDEVRERIIRRFLTNSALPLPDGTTTPPDYIFDPLYGLGAGALIDQNPDASFIAGFTRRMREAVVADAATDPGSLPSITVTTPYIGALQVFVAVQLISGQQGSFSMVL